MQSSLHNHRHRPPNVTAEKYVARLNLMMWRARVLIQEVLTMRTLALALGAMVLWANGGWIRDGIRQATDRQALLPGQSGVIIISSSISNRPSLLYPGIAYGNAPGYSPPYILPHYIHQTVEDRRIMSCQVRESIQTWIDMNPGYTHKLYDAQDRIDFVKKHYPWLLDLFLALPTNVERADTWRYLALHKLGGVYADSDVKCMQPISSWNAEHNHDAALLVGIAKRNMKTGDTFEFNQFVMASMPGHPVMASMPLVITSNVATSFLDGKRLSQQGAQHDAGVLSRTGPGAFTKALKVYAKRVGGPWPINSTLADQTHGILFGTARALPKFVLGMGWDTIDHNMTCLEVKQNIRPEAYICHQFFGTWKKNPEVSIKLTYENCAAGLTYNQYSSPLHEKVLNHAITAAV